MSDKLAKLAKGNAGGKKSPVSATKQVKPTEKQQATLKQKPVVKPVEEKKVLTPEEERDLKAKQKVEELLSDVEFLPKSEEAETVVETVVETKTSNEGVEWLEEQVNLLTEENSALKIELQQAKDDYGRLFNDFQNKGTSNPANDVVSHNVLVLFNELQNNFMGNNQQRTQWTSVQISHILKQMLVLFPFTKDYQKF